jgi:hypothetical protein
MTSAIKSVAILKAILDQNKDVIDNFVPFIVNLASLRRYDGVDVGAIQKDFFSEYGLQIPYHPMLAILGRCGEKGILRCRDKVYHFDPQMVAKHSFAAESQRVGARLDEVMEAFRKFAEAQFGKRLTPDETTLILTQFLRTYDADIILSSRDISLLPQADAKAQETFVFHKFVLHIHQHDHEMYRTLVELAVGYLYASSVLFTELKRKDNAVRNVRLIMDTRLLLRLVGLEGEERKEVYLKLAKTLKNDGAKLRVFEHTVEEMEGILDDCIKWVENPQYNPRYAGPALKHFVENHHTTSDVLLFKAGLESRLTEYGIRRVDGGFSMGLIRDVIDEQKLYDMIVEEYSRNSDKFEEWSRRDVIYRDVKSISATARMRQGAVPTSLRRAKAVFITTNNGLARAAKAFTNGAVTKPHVSECVTDTLLGTIVWLNNPSVVEDLQYKRVLADAVAALCPNDELVEKYRMELVKLKDRQEINEREYFYLRSHPRPLQRLQERTFDDPDAFTDRLPEEILAELRGEIEAELKKKSDGEISVKSETISTMESELAKVKGESQNLRGTVERSKTKVTWLATLITRAISLLSSCLVAALLLLSIHPTLGLLWRLLIGIPAALISAMNLIFGVTIKGYFLPVRNWIQRKLLAWLGMNDTDEVGAQDSRRQGR